MAQATRHPTATPTPRVQRLEDEMSPQDVAPKAHLDDDLGLQRPSSPCNEQRVTVGRGATLAIRELAEQQHGVVAWRQLISLGLDEGLIKHRAQMGHLITIHRGVFAVGHRRLSIHGQWLAAVLACGPSAALSYGSASQLWGIRGSRGPIEVTRRSGHRKPHGVRLHQTRSLPPEHVTVEAGIPVTTPERTLLDLAQRLDRKQMERALVAADRAGRVSWPELREVVREGIGRKGRRMLWMLCHQVNPEAVETRSNPEVDFMALCRDAGLPTPKTNVTIEGRLIDFLWPAAGLIVEVDSYQYHGDRPAFERDHGSTLALTAAGYRVLRVTDQMLEEKPQAFMRLVRDALSP